MTPVKNADAKTTEVKIAPANLPLVFGADIKYTLTLAALTGIGVLGSAYVSSHQRQVGIAFWAMTGLYLLLFGLMLSLRIRVDADGVLQKWLFSGVRVTWKQVIRLDRTRRGYALVSRDGSSRNGREQILLAFLAPAAQQAIAEQAIHRARLRPCAVAPKPPILEQWERKK